MNYNTPVRWRADEETYVRFQVMVYCYMNGLMSGEKPLNNTDINCLTLVGILGKVELAKVCQLMVKYGLSGSIGSARNVLDRLQDAGLVMKEKNKLQPKMIFVAPAMALKKSTSDIVIEIRTAPYETA